VLLLQPPLPLLMAAGVAQAKMQQATPVPKQLQLQDNPVAAASAGAYCCCFRRRCLM